MKTPQEAKRNEEAETKPLGKRPPATEINGAVLDYFEFGFIQREEVNAVATVLERVTKVVVDRLGVDESEVKPEASFRDDLGADSLDVVELVMELEDEFDMEISDDDAENISTVGSAVSYIEEKTK